MSEFLRTQKQLFRIFLFLFYCLTAFWIYSSKFCYIFSHKKRTSHSRRRNKKCYNLDNNVLGCKKNSGETWLIIFIAHCAHLWEGIDDDFINDIIPSSFESFFSISLFELWTLIVVLMEHLEVNHLGLLAPFEEARWKKFFLNLFMMKLVIILELLQ